MITHKKANELLLLLAGEDHGDVYNELVVYIAERKLAEYLADEELKMTKRLLGHARETTVLLGRSP